MAECDGVQSEDAELGARGARVLSSLQAHEEEGLQTADLATTEAMLSDGRHGCARCEGVAVTGRATGQDLYPYSPTPTPMIHGGSKMQIAERYQLKMTGVGRNLTAESGLFPRKEIERKCAEY